MRYLGAALIAALVFTIIIGGTYSQREIVYATYQLIPTPTSQPELVESALTEFSGIEKVSLSEDATKLDITFDEARISVDELGGLISSFGYMPIPLEMVRATL